MNEEEEWRRKGKSKEEKDEEETLRGTKVKVRCGKEGWGCRRKVTGAAGSLLSVENCEKRLMSRARRGKHSDDEVRMKPKAE